MTPQERAHMAFHADDATIMQAVRARWVGKPAWSYDTGYCTALGLERLGVVIADMGFGAAVVMVPRPAWWHSRQLGAAAMKLHGLDTDTPTHFGFRVGSVDAGLLLVCRATGEWAVGQGGRVGNDLVSLGAYAWDVTEGKAAWRIARLCGQRQPRP